MGLANPGETMPLEGSDTLLPLEAHLTLSGVIIGPMVIIGLQFLLYGFYIMVFAVCMMVLKRRNKSPQRIFHFTSMISLFVLATLGLVINTALAVMQAASYFYQWAGKDNMVSEPMMLSITRVFPRVMIATTVLTMLANVLADVVLVFRCYVLWDSRKSMIIVPTTACVLSNAIGIVSMAITDSAHLSPGFALAELGGKATYLQDAYYIMNALINIVLTSMVARKIWLSGETHSQWHVTTARSLKKRYSSISSIILQSGLIYPLILVLSVPFTLCPSLAGWDVYPLLIQVAGICPTLMIVRVWLGFGGIAGTQSSSGSFTLNVSTASEGSWRSV
ncbi:hypothetical protein E1B28_000045 [Marasmius oreades]|uniref:Uncharacterized protein n=1 Tax=Marasmius oreades TaxID=181124 RepID=A0A9P7V0L8_9AGAR|nr:uncharacterized protein E1B28_000045 [Marasmius oreades]KAG7098071.1 hypothetical protein E1B28_000045 [Marasmius oreades]